MLPALYKNSPEKSFSSKFGGDGKVSFVDIKLKIFGKNSNLPVLKMSRNFFIGSG